MDELKNLTVKYLRDLARKHLGKGHSKLKTKEELLDALKEFIPASLKMVGATRAAMAMERAVERVERSAETAVEAPKQTRTKAAQQEQDENQHDAEPLVEGFFVARVVGQAEARRHHMTEDANRHAVETRSHLLYDENLGDLPLAYEDDSAVALPKDPNTVYFYWDFKNETRANAFTGLVDPKAMLRVYDGESLVREVDFALESRSFYVQGLTPGRRYRLEAVAVGRDGKSHRIGHSSNFIALPREGPSPDTSVRFLRAPWKLEIRGMLEHIRKGQAQVRESLEPRQYLDIEEWEELANSAQNRWRKVTERWEGAPGPGPGPRLRRERLGASDKHGGPSGWPSGKR